MHYPLKLDVKLMNNTKTFFAISIISCGLIILFNSVDVYKHALLGAIAEFLWLFLMTVFLLLPLYVTARLIHDKVKNLNKWNPILWFIPVLHVLCFLVVQLVLKQRV